jgi:hypothetical protein
MNNMGREIMAALKRFQVGSDGDGVTVGGSLVVSGSTTANTFSATNVTASGNLTFTGTGNRITGDFSNATIANRVLFQTSTANVATAVNAIPNGTGASSSFITNASSDPDNASRCRFGVGGGTAFFAADATGTGTNLPMNFSTGGSERMRIDTSGNVGIGVVPSAWALANSSALQIKNTSIAGLGTNDLHLSSNAFFDTSTWKYIGTGTPATNYFQTNGTHVWRYAASGTAGNSFTFTEAMRIDSSGNLLVGKTSTALNVTGIQFSTDSNYGRILIQKTFSGTVNGLLNYHNGTYVGGINYDNTSTSFPTSSDVRLKKDIVEAGLASEKIDAIRVVSHGWRHDDAVVDFGLIAQELYEVVPSAVAKGDDGEEIETTWGVDYSKLVPLLIKAHQEQQAMIASQSEIINDLKTRIEALEGTQP